MSGRIRQNSACASTFSRSHQGRETARPQKLSALNADAEPLRFLDFLIRDPEPTVILHGAGIYVHVPAPSRYAVHKLIIFPRRQTVLQSAKDLQQAEALLAALAEIRPRELKSAWEDAPIDARRACFACGPCSGRGAQDHWRASSDRSGHRSFLRQSSCSLWLQPRRRDVPGKGTRRDGQLRSQSRSAGRSSVPMVWGKTGGWKHSSRTGRGSRRSLAPSLFSPGDAPGSVLVKTSDVGSFFAATSAKRK
ncbi:GSU2403 family nucleotidyltransferase fold protein [Bradyrhizobium ivorense]|uniref:GSU2403 family nucleotidyltransferase fold protein n=1 Tax=Bradyrhizobium ivorense TaxID=2511166 RepID=UPI003D3176B0